jgi:hypothetical protein
MDKPRCALPRCQRPLPSSPRAVFCSPRCRWRAWWYRASELAREVEQIPLAHLPAEIEAVLPAGDGRLQVASAHVLLGRAPSGSYGYRVGLKQLGAQLMRWFPAAKLRALPMFLLDPFERPVVPVAGTYAVAYLDARCQPIGGPRFTLAIEETDPRLLYCDGDRTYKPRPRG